MENRVKTDTINHMRATHRASNPISTRLARQPYPTHNDHEPPTFLQRKETSNESTLAEDHTHLSLFVLYNEGNTFDGCFGAPSLDGFFLLLLLFSLSIQVLFSLNFCFFSLQACNAQSSSVTVRKAQTRVNNTDDK
jgi:hypothetical protein